LCDTDALCDYQSKMFKLKTERDQLRNILKMEKEKFTQIEFQAKENSHSSLLIESELHRFKEENSKLMDQIEVLQDKVTEQTLLFKSENTVNQDLKKEVRCLFL
jgi:hypothetical protein